MDVLFFTALHVCSLDSPHLERAERQSCYVVSGGTTVISAPQIPLFWSSTQVTCSLQGAVLAQNRVLSGA